MKITTLGAAGGEVTGSAYCVETREARVLVDCGLFQGGKRADALNQPPLRPGVPLNAVLLTHAHLDHTGRLPLLAKWGFEGPVLATPATVDLTGLILRDSARLQVADAERQNRKLERAGQPPGEPLFRPEDAEQIIGRLQPVAYQEPVAVAPGIRATWAEAGHLLGSASIRLDLEDDGRRKTVVFSGDLGPKGAPILRDFEPFPQADLVFLESTYGDHDHRPFAETVAEFVQIVSEAVDRKGKILIPTFAVGRAQMLTTLMSWMFRNRKVKPFPLFLDSPMAIEASRIYLRHPELYDDELRQYLHERPLQEDLRTLTLTATADESKTINHCPGPCLVMAGAGMCNAGRILHHLKENLWRPEAHVVIVGYQARESLGRRLVDGEKQVSIFGEKIAVKARIHTLGGFSAHAGQKDLLAWFDTLAPSRPRVVLTHGEAGPRETLAGLLRTRYGINAQCPALGDAMEL